MLDLVIYALPPGLPLVVLTMGSVARKRLKDIGLMLINPSILKLGAAIDIVCFDKTGTLTASTVRFVYVAFFVAGTACAALRSEE
jgi:P-type E1-E2 ATPase